MKFSQLCLAPLLVASVLAAPTQRYGSYKSEGNDHRLVIRLDGDTAYLETAINEQRRSTLLDGDTAYLETATGATVMPDEDEQRHRSDD